MSLELCILASGSGGNAALLRTPAGVMLIDAGIGPRSIVQRLEGTGVSVDDLSAICLTHLDADHFRTTWARTILQQNIRVFCHRDRIPDLLALTARDGFASALHPFDGAPFQPLPGLHLTPIRFQHDLAGSHGFVIDGFGVRAGYATDLGQVPDELFHHFCDLDLLALESNYDRDMQLASPRPWFLKQRIMNGAGHLSNEQAFTAIRRILDACESRGHRLPAHIVLLHRSRECNCPHLLRKLFSRDPRIAQRLTLAEQFERTNWLRPRGSHLIVGEQLSLSW